MANTCDRRHSKSVSDCSFFFFFLSLFFLKFSHHERYIYSFDLGEKRNVKIGVGFPGNIQSKDSFSLDPDCAAGSFIDIPT